MLRFVFVADVGPCLQVLFIVGKTRGHCWTEAMHRMRELKVDCRCMSPEHNLIPVPEEF